MSAALGVSTFVYLPYCFFNFLNFAVGMIYGFLGINIMRLPSEEETPATPLAEVPMVIQDR
jgi:Na+:H+ antiporter, NhaC family